MGLFINNLSLLKLSCKISGYFRGMTIDWSSKDHAIVLKQDEETQSKVAFRSYLHTLFTATVFYQSRILFHKSSKYQFSLVDNLQVIIGLSGLLSHVVYLHTCRSKAVNIKLLLNGILQFAKLYQTGKIISCRRKRNFIEDTNVLFAYSLFWSLLLAHFIFLYGLHLHRPCMPSLMGYWIVPECYGNETSPDYYLNTLLKGIVLLVNNFAWCFGAQVVIFGLSILQVLGTISLGNQIET